MEYNARMATENDFLRLTDEQIALLKDCAARTGRPAEELLTEALEQLANRPAHEDGHAAISFADQLSRAGLLGCLSGGASDLST